MRIMKVVHTISKENWLTTNTKKLEVTWLTNPNQISDLKR